MPVPTPKKIVDMAETDGGFVPAEGLIRPQIECSASTARQAILNKPAIIMPVLPVKTPASYRGQAKAID